MLDPIQELGALVNAIRELQSTPDLDGDSSEQRGLMQGASSAISRIASLTLDTANRGALVARAEMVAGVPPTLERVTTMYKGRDAELLVFCGNLKTWYAKVRRGLYSAFVAVPDERLQRAASCFDAGAFLSSCQTILADCHLSLAPPPALVVADLVMCAGEANRHPKHFAYFFPEDDWDVRRVVPADLALRTVIFANVYAHRWMTNSGVRLRRFTRDVWSDGMDRESTVRALLVRWMHGHDLGHAMRHPGTSVSGLRAALGDHDAMIVEETLADCYGFLLLTSPDHDFPRDATDADAAACFIGEMLRYASRARAMFQDSDAALIEIAYLCRVGACDLDRGRLSTDPRRLRRGMIEFAKMMTRMVLDGEVSGLRALLSDHLRPAGAAAGAVLAFVESLFQGTDSIPASTTYVFQP
jgi:hypothetical protein